MAAPTDATDRNSTQWWRSWHGAPTDDKWLVVAKYAGTQMIIVTGVAWALLDYASQNRERGSIAGFDTETYAFKVGIAEKVVIDIIAAMRAKNILDGAQHFTNWDKRQPKREDDSTERVRAYRQRKAETPLPFPDDDVTQSNAAERNDTQANAQDIDIDKDVNSSANAEECAPTPKPLSPHQQLVGALADVCVVDVKLRSNATRVGKVAMELRKGDYTPLQVRAFKDWWLRDPWRREKHAVPSPEEVIKFIAQSLNEQSRASPSNGNGHAPQADPPAQQRLRALRQQAAQEQGVP